MSLRNVCGAYVRPGVRGKKTVNNLDDWPRLPTGRNPNRFHEDRYASAVRGIRARPEVLGKTTTTYNGDISEITHEKKTRDRQFPRGHDTSRAYEEGPVGQIIPEFEWPSRRSRFNNNFGTGSFFLFPNLCGLGIIHVPTWLSSITIRIYCISFAKRVNFNILKYSYYLFFATDGRLCSSRRHAIVPVLITLKNVYFKN